MADKHLWMDASIDDGEIISIVYGCRKDGVRWLAHSVDEARSVILSHISEHHTSADSKAVEQLGDTPPPLKLTTCNRSGKPRVKRTGPPASTLVVDVLRVVPELTADALAEKTGRPYQTVYGALRQLKESGVVELASRRSTNGGKQTWRMAS